MWQILVVCVALAALGGLGAHAQEGLHLSPVTSIQSVILSAQVTVDGMPYDVRPLFYPQGLVEPIMGNGALDTGGPDDIVVAEINGTIRDTIRLAGSPLAVILYGEGEPAGDWIADIPVVYTEDDSLLDAINGNVTVTLTYGRNDYSLDDVNDIAALTVGDHVFAVAVGDASIQIIDVTDPANMVAIDSLPYGAHNVMTVPDTQYLLITHQEGLYILDMSQPYRPQIVRTITDDTGGYDMLGGASDIEMVTSSDRTFAVVTAFDDDGIQIIDVTDPLNPRPASSATDDMDGYEALDGARGVDTAVISGRTYGVVTSYNEDAIQLIDLVNPYMPLPVSIFFNDTDDSVRLDGATDVEIRVDNGETYAIVTSYNDGAIQIVNITTPTVPTDIRSLADDEGRFDALAGATDIDVVDIGSTTYGLISAYRDDAVQIIDLNNPSLPRAVGNTLDDEDYEFNLDGVRGLETITFQGTTYLLAAAHLDDGIQVISLERPAAPIPVSNVAHPKDVEIPRVGSWGMDSFVHDGSTYVVVSSYHDDAIQVINITNPHIPLPVSNVFDEHGQFEALGGSIDVEVIRLDGRVYAIVASYDDDSIQIINMTDPADPQFVQELFDGEDGFDGLDGPLDIETATISGRVYAIVASYDEDAIQIIDLIDPTFPLPTTSIHRGDVFVADEDIGEEDPIRLTILDGPRGLAVVDILDKTYCLVASQNDDTVLILDISNPSQPWPISIIHDDLQDAHGLNGASDIEILEVRNKIYALVTGKWDGSVQILDITDPVDPEVVTALFDNTDGYVALNGASDIEVAPMFDRTLAVVSGSFDDAIQIIDVTDPTNPLPADSIYDGSRGFHMLDGADDIEVVRISGHTYILIGSVDDEAIQIARLE